MLKQYKLKNYPFALVFYLAALTGLGIVVIGSAKASVQNKQILGFALGMIIMIFLSFLDYSMLLNFSWLFYGGTVGLLLLVELVGDSSHGSQRWIEIAGIKFQPSELAKIMVILFFAWFFMKYQEKINTFPTLMLTFLLAVIPMFLIFTQPDTSTTIVVIFIFAVLLYLAGLSYKIIVSVIAVCLPLGIAGIAYIVSNAETLIQDHYQVKRIMSLIDPTNPLYSDYATQQQNSIMAIASGGLLGKGLGTDSATSLKNSNYIIEPQTDLIFAVVGEELGFLGTAAVLLLLILIVVECIRIGSKAKDLSGKLICAGMASLISFQSFVNLCVATGLMPTTGVTLPFVSYGLTSLVSMYIGMGFVLNVGLQQKKSKSGGFL